MANLTVIFGKNNSGKTTLARLPLFIAASLRAKELFVLAAGPIRFGASFRDLAPRSAPHPAVTYFASLDTGERVEVELQNVTQALRDSVVITQLRTRADAPPPRRDDSTERGAPNSEDPQVRETLAAMADALEFLHIPSYRPEVRRVYVSRPPDNPSVDEAAFWLYNSEPLLAAVSEWFSVNYEGIEVDIERSEYGFSILTRDGGEVVNFANSGRGLQALLPIVTLLKGIQIGLIAAQAVILEEPEAHLHPSAHGAVADLLAEVSSAVQILTETHSENFILRLRRRVADTRLASESLAMYFVGDANQVVPVGVNADGSVSEWPDGVFEYDLEEARAIVEARISRLGVTAE